MGMIAQIFAFIALISYVISFQQRNKGKILKYQIIAYTLYAIQYFLLGAFAAGFMDIAALASSMLFYYDNKEKKKTPLYVLIIIITLIGISGIFTIKDLNSAIPIVTSIIFIYSIWQENISILRTASLFKSFAYIAYNLIVGAYIGAIGSSVTIMSVIISILRFDIKK